MLVEHQSQAKWQNAVRFFQLNPFSWVSPRSRTDAPYSIEKFYAAGTDPRDTPYSIEKCYAAGTDPKDKLESMLFSNACCAK